MIKSNLPVILLKNLVLLPYQDVRVEIKSSVSKKVTEISKLYHDSEVLVVCPLNSLEENPDASDLPKIGVVGKIKSVIELPNGNMRVIISGLYRVKVISYVNYSEDEEVLDSIITSIENTESEIETTAYARKLTSELENYVNKNPFITNSIMSEIKRGVSLDKLTDLVGGFLTLSFEKKLSLMLDASPISRSKSLIKEIAIESAVIDLEGHIETQIKKNLDDSEKEYILKEKLKVIKDELGETLSKAEEVIDLRDKVNNGNFPERIRTKLLSEIDRYDASSEMSPDAGIIRNYIEYLLEIPWFKETRDEKDLIKIEKKLDASHYAMNEAKNRIIEYIAVKSITDEVNSPIICLVGPPGVGKTTFAESISKALNRNFVKISLGGMSDSAELIGHRRAYIGSNPGKIVTSLIKCGSNNPVFLLDEVDKLKKDYKGDPASTLLDILDVSQNKRFVDNYIDEEIDLSNILFILTANDINSIPIALLDRLEIISLSGYTTNEKVFICENYIIPNMMKKHGLKNSVFKFDREAIERIINNYTNEAGVRELERCLSKICRKVITEHIKASRRLVSVRITAKDLSHYLDKDEHWQNFLYFPYYYILSKDSNINVALLHELIHVVETTPKSIGLTDGKVGVLNNEIRTDFLAMELNKKLKKPLVPNDNLIEGEYHNFYLTISEPFHDFYKENWDLLGHLAIKGNLELLSKIYGDYWNYFLEETDKLYFVTKYVSENFGKNAQSIEYDYRMIHYLVHKMKVEKEKNLKKIKIR